MGDRNRNSHPVPVQGADKLPALQVPYFESVVYLPRNDVVSIGSNCYQIDLIRVPLQGANQWTSGWSQRGVHRPQPGRFFLRDTLLDNFLNAWALGTQ